MEKRKFNIDIFKWSQDWWITINGFEFESQNEHPPLDVDYGFAKHGITDDKKIVYLFSNGLHNIDITALKDKDIFNEILSFKCFIDEKATVSFNGTFIEALEYIKKAFNNE